MKYLFRSLCLQEVLDIAEKLEQSAWPQVVVVFPQTYVTWVSISMNTDDNLEVFSETPILVSAC